MIVVPMSEWRWFGMPGHFIGADSCRFRLCTAVGKWLVSTVGDYHPPSRTTRTEIGLDRFYETMVWRAGGPCVADGCCCLQPSLEGDELDMAGYQTGFEAQAGHLAMCRKWAEKQ